MIPQVSSVEPAIVMSGGFKEKSFKIKDPKVIYEILSSSIYTNKIGAIVREIISNAIDANQEVKSEFPINVHLPTIEEPWFSVRDFGPGLDNERMKIFVEYGNSTKRDSNEQIGYYGLGSKSPFSYTDSFYITSYINGYCNEYNAFINDEQDRKLVKLNQTKSIEYNGVEIKLFIKNNSDISKFTTEFKNIWKYSLHLFSVNAYIQPISKQSILNSVFKKENVWFGNSSNDGVIFLNGNVAYTFTQQQLESLSPNIVPCELKAQFLFLYKHNLVVKFKIGELQLSVSRETINVSDHNAKLIVEKLKGIYDEIRTNITSKLYVKSFLYRRNNNKLYSGIIGDYYCNSFAISNTVYEIFTNRTGELELKYQDRKSFNIFEKITYLYYFSGELDKLKSRVLKFLTQNNLKSCCVIRLTDSDYKRIQNSEPNFPMLPLHMIQPIVKERKELSVRKTKIEIYTSVMREYYIQTYKGKSLQSRDNLRMGDPLQFLDEYQQGFYVPLMYSTSVIKNIDLDNILNNYQGLEMYRELSQITTPIYSFNKSVIRLVPKHWKPFEEVFSEFILNTNHAKLYYYLLKRYITKNTYFNMIKILDNSIKHEIYKSVVNLTTEFPIYNVKSITYSDECINIVDSYLSKHSKTYSNLMSIFVSKLKKISNEIITNYHSLFLPDSPKQLSHIKNKYISNFTEYLKTI